MSNHRRWIQRGPIVLGVAVLFTAAAGWLTPEAEAVQIKKVYHGVANFDNADIVISTALSSSVDPTKAIILLSSTTATNTADMNVFFTSQFESNMDITVNRSGVNAYGGVSYQVVEFADGVSVVRGISSMRQNVLTKQITLPAAINTAVSLPIITVADTENSTANTDQLFVIPTFPNSTTLQLDRAKGSSNKSINIVWQVAQFLTDTNVYTGTVSFPVPGSVTYNQNVTANQALSNSGNNALLFFYLNPGTANVGIDAQFYTRGTITSGSPATLSFVRQYAPATANTGVTVRYYVVDFTDGTNGLGLGQKGQTAQFSMTPTTVAISSSTDATPIVITTSAAHGYSTGDFVNITGHAANLTANGNFVITVLTNTTFSLNGSVGFGAGSGSGGKAMTAMNTALGTTLNTVDRGLVLTSVSASGNGNNVSNKYADDLSLANYLNSTSNVAVVRDSSAVAVLADCNYFAYEFPPLTVKTPNGNEVWPVGSTQNITWKHALDLETGGSLSGGHHAGKIELSIDGGSTYPLTAIATNVDLSTDSYSWTIPATISSTEIDVKTCQIKITDTEAAFSSLPDSRRADVSNANFEVRGVITVTAPTTSTWLVGTTQNITWTTNCNLNNNGNGKVRLELWTYSGGTYVYNSDITSSLTDPTAGSGTYAWTIPDNIGPQYQVKAKLMINGATAYTSLDGSELNAFSNATGFAIKAQLTLTAPTGGASWPAQTTQNITWNKTGTFSTLSIYYSTNSGGNYPNTIVTGTAAGAASGSYAWLVPVAAISNFMRIQVISDQAANVQVQSTSSSDNTVVPSINVTSPTNGSELWRVGESHNITWTINGSIPTVKIEYSTNGGTSWVSPAVATGVTASNGTYAWTIPDAIGDTTLVKISDEAAPATRYATSANNFKIRGSITVTAPNGGEVWAVGSSQTISWTRNGSFGNADILYSTDGGTTFPSSLATNITGTNWTWNPIPDAIGTTVKVRVQATNALYSGDTLGVSGANFAIKGALSITAPNGGEAWTVATSQNITWTKQGTIGTVNLTYSTDGGSTYPNTIVASVAASSLSYSWTVPNTTGTQYRVKITLNSDATVYSASSANFSVKGSFTLTAPVGGESWVVGAVQNITWTKIGSMANAKLEYSTDGGSTWPAGGLITSSVSASALSYAWTIPDAIGSNLKVRISDASDATVNNVSPSAFTIKGSLTITAPVGGEVWIVGASNNITWTKTGTIPNVKLLYSTNGGTTYPNVIVASTSGSSLSYPWTIPDVIGTSLRVQIVDLNAVPGAPSSSPTNFTIKGSLAITAPNGGEQWSIFASQNITWTEAGTLTGNLKLEYSTDGGTTYPAGNLISNTVAASSTSYAWTIPNSPSTTSRVRITYLNDTTVSTQSAANFSIKGSVTVTAPVGGEVWIVNDARNITWTIGGAIANVALDYSTDGGATFPNSITASTTASNLSYTWTVPNSIGTQLRVRATSTADSTVTSMSPANFTIKGSLTLTSPVGGETWIVNDVHNITWTKNGTIANVELDYSADGGSTYPNVINSSTPGANLSYAWTVPDAIGNSLRVKIKNTADTTVNSASGANFTVIGSVAITSPVGGETWIVGDSHNVTWNKQGSIANVKLEYSKDGFVDELQTFVIIASTPGSNLSYAWTVADAIGTTLKVRVSDASNATVKSLSAANFTIKGKLTLTSPAGGEVWTVQSSHNITWTRTGSIVNVQLAYSIDGGSTFPNTITSSTDASVGSYAWTIPDAIGITVKVRVINTADATVFNDSPANFKIAGTLAVTSPVGGEKWTVGTAYNITWTRTGSIANAKLDYSTDGGSTYPNAIVASTPASALSYSWTVPNSPSATVRVRISDASDSTILGTSAANFKIRAGITVTAPVGGEVWTVNDARSITWTTVGTAANVKLEYSTDGGNTYPNLIVASTTNTGSYSWTVPDSISTSARVKVTNTADSDSVGASPANFKIRGALSITAPVGGEGWQINTVQNITWTRTGSIANVKLEYSTDAFSDELQTTVIVASTSASAGSYAWTIPNAPSPTVKVRVSDASDASVLSISPAVFSIKGSLSISSPVGGEVWVVGGTNNIIWSRFGNIANVKLEYSTDGGVTYPLADLIIASTSASALSYSWTIPDSIGSTLRVRISDASDATVNTASPANFAIKGSIALTSPVGNETWVVGDTHNITWTKTGSFANVKLEYSTNAFANETQTVLITAGTSNSGTFAWTVPDAIGTTVKIRASDASNATVVSVSGSAFTIKGSFLLTSPVGGEVWKVGESRNITWSKTGSIATAKLEYSTNAGSSYANLIIASTDATTGTYAWTVPDAIGTTLRVRITNTADATVSSSSPANFTIKGQVTVTAPVGGEVWVVSSVHNITWTKQGTFSTVKLEYSTNAFVDETQTTVITASVDAVLGTPYAWTVPDAIGASLRVRVTNNSDTTVFAVSGANFKITGSLTLTAPNGGELWTVASAKNVTWTRVGSIANVKLDYSTDGGTTYSNVIVASTAAGTGAYSWTVPDAIGTNRRVRVSDASDSTVFATSAANFTIMGGFTISAPNGGEIWSVGASKTISWTTAGSVANTKLDYSTDGGSTYPNAITASTANTGTYAWTVPDAITTLARVRISDVNNANAFATSAANFKIQGLLNVTSPIGGEIWTVGSSHNVTWTKGGSIANVKLEYSVDGGTTYPGANLITASTSASALSYAWTVPDAIGNQLRVRASDASDPTVNAVSAANFSIQGSLTITAPNGGEVWVVGSAHNITWTKVGSIANVKLEYSTDGGGTYPVGNLIVASTLASALSYSWTVPDAIGTQLRVRVSDASNAAVKAVSVANFSIQGSLTITAPNGGEVWVVGATQNITWTKTGSFANVKLEYSTDGGSTYPAGNLITSSTSNTGTFAWTIPDSIGTTVKVRASDANDSTVIDDSNVNFTIKGSFSITSPVGGEVWRVGEVRNITWSKTGTIATAKLEYSTDGGTTYSNLISASTSAATGTYAWTVPDAIGTLLRVRITNTADATVTSSSPANFTVKGSLTVTSPVGGEVWVVQSVHNITWTKQGTFSTVKLEYSTDGGTTYPTVITASVDAALGTPYAWTIPDAIGTQLRVRVTNNSDATVFATSGANFKIAGSLTLTAPNGGENWTVGTVQNVTWTRVGSIANAKLDYSTDGGTTYPNVIVVSTGAGAGAYAWTIPDAIGVNRRVRISDASDSTVLATSAANFTIMGGFTISAPNGGEVWTVGASRNITWTTAGSVVNVKLEYSTDGGSTYPNLINASTSNTGTYVWTVPDSISALVRVKVSDVNNANAFKISAANFKIQGALTVTAPNGGESWTVGSSRNITWTKLGSIANVKLEYSTDGGVSYLAGNMIIASTSASALSYAWTIPDAIGSQVRVRISDASDSTVNAQSSANFSIKGSLTLTSPNGGEVWVVSTVQNITWTRAGSVANVKLEYSTDGGVTYPVGQVIIASTVAAPLSYSWTIPDAIGSQLRVRVSDASDATVNTQSAANFSIKGSITLTSPVGGEVWIVGAAQNITWTKTGSFPNVKLEYSTNGFLDELQTVLVTASTPNNLTFAWTVPDAIGTTVKVRASDSSNATTVSVSGTNFTIKGSLTMTSPNGGEVWRVGESRNITWMKTGSIANVKLEYSTDGGTTYSNMITASTSAATGTYAWTVADAIGTTRRVRITNTSDATVTAASAANFEIKGQITVTAPIGGEIWVVGTSHNITWTKQGTFSFVKLEYSTDGGTTYSTVITASVDATTGTPYAWTVPDAIGSQLRVRVTNTADVAVLATSAANFKIVGSLTLTAPIGGESWTVGTAQSITWMKVGSIANVKLDYSTDGGTTYPNVIIASTPAGTGAYVWTIPDSIGANRRVKVSDASDSTVFTTSAANFTIMGGFTISAPNGGEVWTVASAQTISWTTVGTVANVKLEYSTDGGTTYPNVIIASTANTGIYGWTVPDAITTLAKVRVSDVNNANAFKVSAANFKIRGALTVTAPNGGESWSIGTTQNITWTRTGSIANVKLEYSTDGGTTYSNVITASTPASTGTYAWLIPNAPSAIVRMRVSDASDLTVNAISSTNFSIIGRVTITAPNGGEVWIVGQNYNITWTLGGSIANVKIQYSTDGGATWPDPGKVIIASTAASLLSYTWTIPDDISNTVKVRASDTSNPSVFGASTTNFAIKGSLAVTAPVGSEIWLVGTSQNITWTKSGTIANVKLEYSIDGGTTYPNLIVASVNATTGTPYAWTIPDAIGNTVRVKVTHTGDSAVFGMSAANFSIKGSLTVISPNGGEVWTVGSAQPITWSKVGSIANVKLEYSTDGGVTYPNMIVNSIAAGLGSYSWTIPDAITTTARVKVTNTADTTVFANSTANFKIAGSLTMTAPVGGEQWSIGSSRSITWTKTGSIANVKLEYSTDGGTTYPNLIMASVDATLGTPYTWVIPDNPTATAKVKVTNTADATVFSASPASFKIQGSFTLTAPNGGQSWVVGQSQNITWTKTGAIPNAKLEYSTDGGVTYPNLIVAATPASNLTYAWVVPDAIGTTVRVKITDAGDPAVTASSAANFTIKGSLALTAPNGGEAWIVGTTQNITWTRTGSIASVKLEYSKNAFVDETQTTVIVASTAGGNLSYAWIIPDAIGSTVKVRISDVAGISLGATSAGNFAIKGSLTITAPNGGEIWVVGTTQNITWTKTGSIANVKLEYSTNGFTTATVITASTSASAGTYAWVVPDAISNTVKVRATDASDASVLSASSSNFTIKGALTITSPIGGEKWVVGTAQNITWNRAGSIANVKLQYTTNGTIYTDIIVSTPNTGSYSWVIPNTTTITARVRIYDVNDASVTNTSAADFRIQAGFTLTSPNGGENWLVGSSQNISWTTLGTVAFVKLDYSMDGGVTFPGLINSSTSNTGTYAWTVPDAVSGSVQVRVSDASDATAVDTSNANFRIRASFTLSAPNGSEQWRIGQVQNIVWSAVGTIPSTKLQYSRDGFVADIQTINAAAPSTGTYAWTIPDAISNTVKVRVSDPNDVGALKDSAANFRITGDFTVTAPNGGEQWIVGNTYNITWTKTGSVTNAKIEYSTDGGGTYSTIVGLTLNNGTYAWTIPNTITAIARVRVSDPNDATANGISAANFKIKAGFTITSPVGGEVWTVGTAQNITWTNTGTVSNVKLSYSTDSGVSYPNVITASVSNTGTYTWTIPDAIFITIRAKVESTTDVNAFATSPANFKIRGAFTLTAPNGGEGWKIAQTFNITWTTTGTIPTVKLSYSTDSGATYSNVITASVANTNLYAWVIPDTPSTTARVRVENPADNTVFATSAANFSLQGNFTITSPNGGEIWAVNDVRNITWTWGGTIPNVKLTYSTDGGGTYLNTIAASAPNGVGSSGTFSYAWTVPDAISTTARVKVEDPNNAAVFGTSNANFKIQGKLVIAAPTGAERWVVNESRAIIWTTAGTIPNVKIEYSTDSGSTYPAGNLIVASTPNTGTYTWVIPSSVSTTVRVRVSNVTDSTVFGQSAADFKIDLYQITFDIRDLLSNNSINQLTVSAATTPTAYTWAASGLASPIVKGLQAGSWSATFTQTAYGDLTLNFVADRDQTLQGFMETKVVHVWSPATTVSYTPSTDTLVLASLLTRDGINVTGATSCVVKVYDGPTLLNTFSITGAPDVNTGQYSSTWASTGLVTGKAYVTVTTIGISTGGQFTASKNFTVTNEKQLQSVQDTVNAKLDTPLSQVKSDIQVKLDAQTGTINTKLDSQTTIINTQLNTQTNTINTQMANQTAIIDTKTTDMKTAIQSKMDEFSGKVASSLVSLDNAAQRSQVSATNLEDAAAKSQAAASELERVGKKYAARLLIPPSVLMGDSVTLRYRAGENLSPLIDLFTINSDGKTVSIAKGQAMGQTKDNPGLYEYTVKVTPENNFVPNKPFNIFVQEPTTGNLEAGSVFVDTTSLGTLEGLIAAGSSRNIAQETLDAVKAVKGKFDSGTDVNSALELLKTKMDRLPQEVVTESGSAQMGKAVKEVAETIKNLAGSEGYDFSQLVKKGVVEGVTEAKPIKELRKKMDGVEGSTEVMQILMERKYGGVDAPVVDLVYE